MSTRTKKLGDWGEEKAVQYLIENGYTIIKRNFRWARGEIDIVAENDDLLIFIEVKTAASAQMGEPANWVTQRKQKQIAQVAQKFLQDNRIENKDCRFDVIGIMKSGNTFEIQHIENAFWLEQTY
ncbi:MAG: YraN family protein [bacterium]